MLCDTENLLQQILQRNRIIHDGIVCILYRYLLILHNYSNRPSQHKTSIVRISPLSSSTIRISGDFCAYPATRLYKSPWPRGSPGLIIAQYSFLKSDSSAYLVFPYHETASCRAEYEITKTWHLLLRPLSKAFFHRIEGALGANRRRIAISPTITGFPTSYPALLNRSLRHISNLSKLSFPR
jgi:hypothetical protein